MDRARRELVRGLLLGGGALGLRSALSGLPTSWLTSPRTALAQSSEPAGCDVPNAQFLVLSASESGDPINANVPGTYDEPRFVHSSDVRMEKTSFMLGQVNTQAARPWATLPAALLARTTFFHHATQSNAHPNHAKVLALLGQTRRQEMLPSIYSRLLAPCLGTVQREPLAVGAASSGELLKYEGRTLSQLSPRGLKSVLQLPAGALADLRTLRDNDLDRMNTLFKQHGTSAQRSYLDRLATSQREARAIPEALLDTLSSITSNDPAGQILAASVLIRMKVAPVVTLHIPFGGDNHSDLALARETDQTVAGVASIASLFQRLGEVGLADQTSFALFNVFGRTLASNEAALADNGRTHNPEHAVSVLIGKGVRAGIVGGVQVSGKDAVAQAIDSASGLSDAAGDIPRAETMSALAKTLGVCLGIQKGRLEEEIFAGKVVESALA